MNIPEDIPEDVWTAAVAVFTSLFVAGSDDLSSDTVKIARALLAAEKRGVDRERERWKPAVVYFERYCQDEAEDEEECVCGRQQHDDAKAFAAAIRRGEG